MSENLLRGNFKTKREVVEAAAPAAESGAAGIAKRLKEKALASLGGSMIYVDRTALDWDLGQEEKRPG